MLPSHRRRPVEAVREIGPDDRVAGVGRPLHVDVHISRQYVLPNAGNAVPIKESEARWDGLLAWKPCRVILSVCFLYMRGFDGIRGYGTGALRVHD